MMSDLRIHREVGWVIRIPHPPPRKFTSIIAFFKNKYKDPLPPWKFKFPWNGQLEHSVKRKQRTTKMSVRLGPLHTIISGSAPAKEHAN